MLEEVHATEAVRRSIFKQIVIWDEDRLRDPSAGILEYIRL